MSNFVYVYINSYINTPCQSATYSYHYHILLNLSRFEKRRRKQSAKRQISRQKLSLTHATGCIPDKKKYELLVS